MSEDFEPEDRDEYDPLIDEYSEPGDFGIDPDPLGALLFELGEY